MRLLLTVRARYQFMWCRRGRCGLFPGTPEQLRPGDRIELQRPDGTVMRTRVYSLITRGPAFPGTACIELSPLILRKDVPQGTEVWLLSADEAPALVSR